MVRWEDGGDGKLGDMRATYLFLMMQTLVVVFEYGLAFSGTAVVFGRGVCDVAGEDFLPEGEAAGWAWVGVRLVDLDGGDGEGLGGGWRYGGGMAGLCGGCVECRGLTELESVGVSWWCSFMV